ncbi:MAG TPA: methylated-DNA--[protein]-cysteine S-methyltransferase [Chloroflexota bacterium]|nr:methylated-DNA--[protein]-cysteine S-methyltransferase [Chloroflexota bacterium]
MKSLHTLPVTLNWSFVETAWGLVPLAGEPDALTFVGYPQSREDAAIAELTTELGRLGIYDEDLGGRYADRIAGYFAGEPLNWSEIPARLSGTPFQNRVWQTTREIPYGQAWTYAEVARASGTPLGARAAGTALANNRAGLLVPCHRVVAAGGIGGYGHWRERKLALLRLEGAVGRGVWD